jgi:hypothetical protein
MEADLLLLFDVVDVLLLGVWSANEVYYSPNDCLLLV